mgnify:CR=1 FL=1
MNYKFIEYLIGWLPYYNENLAILLGDYAIEKDGAINVHFFVSKKGFQSIDFYKTFLQEQIEKIEYETIFNKLINDLSCEYLENTVFVDKLIKSVMDLFKKYEIELIEFSSRSCVRFEFKFLNEYEKTIIIRNITPSIFALELDSSRISEFHNYYAILLNIEEYLKKLTNKEN